MERTAAGTFLYMARSRLVVHLTGQIRACLDVLNDQQIWWRPNAEANAVGNLVLHCAGSTRHYIGHVVGGIDFVRDRDAEFAARDALPAGELRAQLDAAVAEADRVLRAFDPATLLAATTRTPKPSTYLQVIGLQLTHYAAHTGQIAYATKLLRAGGLDDLWRKTPSH